MASNPQLPGAFDLTVPEVIVQAEEYYAGLILFAAPESDPSAEPGLGGKLLYTGEFDAKARALVIAANIAGAASLAVTADAVVQKQAIRDGVVDFLVTSLDEALRILKNEIRKRETVAVCIAAAPEIVEREMQDRGVLPDLLRPANEGAEPAPFITQGARQIPAPAPGEDSTLLTWSVAIAPAQWLPRLDAIAMGCLNVNRSPASLAALRWLRLSPRYLGRLAQGVRLLRCDEETNARICRQIRERVELGEITVSVKLQSVPPTASMRARSSFTP